MLIKLIDFLGTSNGIGFVSYIATLMTVVISITIFVIGIFLTIKLFFASKNKYTTNKKQELYIKQIEIENSKKFNVIRSLKIFGADDKVLSLIDLSDDTIKYLALFIKNNAINNPIYKINRSINCPILDSDKNQFRWIVNSIIELKNNNFLIEDDLFTIFIYSKRIENANMHLAAAQHSFK